MRSCSRVIVSLALIVSTSAAAARAHQAAVPFVQNDGSQPAAVRFYAQTVGGTVFVTDQGFIRYALPRADRKGGVVFDECFSTALTPAVEAGKPSATRLSSFLGKDPSAWRAAIPCFESVSLGEVYEGVRVELRAYGKNVEKLFTVAPGSSADRIAIRVDGGRPRLDEATGELVIETAAGDVRFTRPIAYQDLGGERVTVDVAYRTDGASYGFELGAYDGSLPVVIDPLLAATFVGGSDEEAPGEMVLDAAGNVLIAASSSSADYPETTGLIGPTNAFNMNVVLSKISPDLGTLIASSILGGDDYDIASDLTLGGGGLVYVTGMSYSTNFPTTVGAFQELPVDEEEVFVVCLDDGFTALLASTYLGGDDEDFGLGIAASTNGSIYVVGRTDSTNFPVGTNDFQLTKTDFDTDAFVSHLDASLTTLLNGTYLGDNAYDGATDVAIGPFGGVFVVGMTASPQFPTTPGAFDRFLNSAGDGFITSFEPELDDILRSTLIGGDSVDSISGVAVTTGLVYVAGETRSDNFPVTPGAYDETANGLTDASDAFVARLDFLLLNVQAATFLGGSSSDLASDIALDATGNVYVVGATASHDFPTVIDTGAKAGQTNTLDAYVSRLTPNLAFLVYSRFLGGENNEGARSVSVNASGEIFVSGITLNDTNANFVATAGAFDTTIAGDSDIFIAKVTPVVPPTPEADNNVAYDFDNDDRADVGVFHPLAGTWYIQDSGTGNLRQQPWGWQLVTPVPADYDGDTIADIAVYYQDTGTWYVKRSSDGQYWEQHWGWSAALPVPADYDGDGHSDLAVYHPDSGTWYVLQSSNGQIREQQWGYSQAIPVPGDFDGDLVDDIAVFDPGSSTWYILRSSDSQLMTQQWGFAGVSPVTGDFDGDGATDISVYEPWNAVWYIRLSASGSLGGKQWGWSEVVPAPADYDGDGKDDIAVYHPQSGGWYIDRSSDGELHLQQWGWADADALIRQNYINDAIPPIVIPLAE